MKGNVCTAAPAVLVSGASQAGDGKRGEILCCCWLIRFGNDSVSEIGTTRGSRSRTDDTFCADVQGRRRRSTRAVARVRGSVGDFAASGESRGIFSTGAQRAGGGIHAKGC
ncbi:hypothetical protein HPP92_017103 [Vanilla planifolia]|uniref:Uncharacterized protein n=1 Tax=Vanilla planifolia TaxID=51239 RepID=A0A835QKM0_VANPL|nr:hypothetical protein HPP92_017103 [Vanilla planifolia]